MSLQRGSSTADAGQAKCFDALQRPGSKQHALVKTIALVAISVAIRIVYLALRPDVAVSVDVWSWHTVARLLLSGHNPYAETTLVNWPPVWPGIIYALAKLSIWSGIRFITLIFAVLIGVEQIMLVIVTVLIRRLSPSANWFLVGLLGIAVNPIAILQVAQHGNFDVMLGLFFALAFLSIMCHLGTLAPADWLYACLFVGLAAACKQVGLVFIPMLVPGLHRVPRRFWPLGLLLVFGPVTAGIGAIYYFAPQGVWDHVIQYRSAAGYFGVSGVLYAISEIRTAALYQSVFSPLLAISLLGASAYLFKSKAITASRLLLISIALPLAVPTLGPGWAPQYIYWWMPLAVVSYAAIEDRSWRSLLWVSYVLTTATYVLQYGALAELGAVVLKLFPGSSLFEAIARNWSDTLGQTILRGPMCLAMMAMLGWIVYLLRSSRMDSTPPPSHTPAAASSVA